MTKTLELQTERAEATKAEASVLPQQRTPVDWDHLSDADRRWSAAEQLKIDIAAGR